MAGSTQTFTPTHCPNPKCLFHGPIAIGWRHKKAGFYARKRAPIRIQRFRCCECGRHFSTQTFHVSYWLKRPDVLPALLTKTVGCMANRQIARDLGVSPKTVDDQLSRLGRHCLLYHAKKLRGARAPTNVVVDGFETFELSQYYPFHFNVCVEKETDFVLGFTDSELRRKGRMTREQKKRRAQLERLHGRPDPGAVRKQMQALLHDTAGNAPSVTIHSDDHPAYPGAIRRLGCRTTHRVTPGRDPRTIHNPLFPVNLLDLIIRHSQAGHKRETIAFAKRRAASAERLAILVVWRNYIKRRREKSRRSPTPAMAKGMTGEPLTVGDLLQQRLFFHHTPMSERWNLYYRRRVLTRGLPKHKFHELKYAF